MLFCDHQIVRTDTDDHPTSCFIITVQRRLQDAAACVGAVCFYCSAQQTRWVEVEVGGEQHQNNPDPKKWIKHPRDFIYILSWGLQREAEDGWTDGFMDGWMQGYLSQSQGPALILEGWECFTPSEWSFMFAAAFCAQCGFCGGETDVRVTAAVWDHLSFVCKTLQSCTSGAQTYVGETTT